MAGAPGIPQNLTIQTANAQVLVSWDLSTGATSYIVQRSLDNVTFTTLATVTGSPLHTYYLDTAVTPGTQYWYQVAASNTDGTSSYTTSQDITPANPGETTLGAIRLAAMQTADRVNSNFVTKAEWNSFINLAQYELYDLLIGTYEDYYIGTPIQFTTNGSDFIYPLPNGLSTFNNGLNPNLTFTPPALYKLMGVDLALQSASNAYVTINKFNFIDRNRFVFPNTASTIYGVFNMQYRMLGTNIEFIPTPSANQSIRLWYIPRLTELLNDTDMTSTSVSGWIRYVIVRAAIYALAKEESDTSLLVQELTMLKARIEEMAANRDQGQPDRISDTRSGNGGWGGNGFGGGFNGPVGGFGLAMFPFSFASNQANAHLTHTINFTQSGLGYIFCFIAMTYFLYLFRRELGASVFFSRIRNFLSSSLSFLSNHIMNIILLSSNKQMIRINTVSIIAGVTNKKSFRNGAFEQFVGYSSSYKPFSSNRKSRALRALTVSFFITASPLPAIAGIINSVKKSFMNSFSSHKSIISYLRRLVK